MKHRRIPKSDRHKKIKSINPLQEFNFISDDVIKNANQPLPRKLREIIESRNNPVKAKSKRKKNIFSDESITVVKPSEHFQIEPGMTRKPKPLPAMVIKHANESDHHFLNRLNKLVSKSMAEANLEEHFDVDLGGKIENDDNKSNNNEVLTSVDDEKKLLEKKQRKKEKNRKNLLRKKLNKLRKQHRLLKHLNNDDEFRNQKECIEFGETVHCPPNLDKFSKVKKKVGIKNLI